MIEHCALIFEQVSDQSLSKLSKFRQLFLRLRPVQSLNQDVLYLTFLRSFSNIIVRILL